MTLSFFLCEQGRAGWRRGARSELHQRAGDRHLRVAREPAVLVLPDDVHVRTVRAFFSSSLLFSLRQVLPAGQSYPPPTYLNNTN